MRDKYGIEVGSSIYILPEEAGNSLKFDFRKEKFVTQYADPEQNDKRERAQNFAQNKSSNKSKQQKLS